MNIIKDINFREFIAKQQSQSIRPASDFYHEAMERITNGVNNVGDPMPWAKTHSSFRFREGELTIWAGVNGSGKSLVMGQCALWLCKHTPVLIASMEMLGAATVARMLRQASGEERPHPGFVNNFDVTTNDNLWIYDQVGSVDRDSIIGMIHWAAKEKGIKHIMIDSLVKCGVDQERNEPQKRFLDDLCWAAKEHKVHIHLVNHMRKPMNRHEIPDKFAIKGAGEITDLADNVIIVARNVSKEEDRMNGKAWAYDDPDCYMRIAKQRHGEWEGLFKFWFDPKSLQWLEDSNSKTMEWL